jgi:hypothetical protein
MVKVLPFKLINLQIIGNGDMVGSYVDDDKGNKPRSIKNTMKGQLIAALEKLG